MNKLVSSKHLESVSDLTLIAPIKQGFVAAFESVTYETRLQLLLKALFKIRATAREHSMIKPFVDTAERIQSLLDFRLAVLDTEPRQLMLSATFDRPFEPYMRLIWDPLGPLLDVIFCNCEGYVTATGHSFEEYLAWVRKSQVDSDFFYSMSGHSVSDVQYLLQIERLQREKLRGSGASIFVENPEMEAQRVREEAKRESQFLGMEALVALYRLTDFYPPDDPKGDGELLRTATQQLLRGWGEDLDLKWKKYLIRDQLVWFGVDPDRAPPKDDEKVVLEKQRKEKEEKEEQEAWQHGARLKFDPKHIQGGILVNYGKEELPVRHGALLLMRITDAEKARGFIGTLKICDGCNGMPWPKAGIFLNLGLTWRGLVNIGVPESELARFPQEFREGMEDRAGLLGDLRASHPRRWLPPLRNWPKPATADRRVALSEVDLVLQLRTTNPSTGRKGVHDVHDPDHPLREAIGKLAQMGKDAGVELLAVEAMRRAFADDVVAETDHFGFIDGLSQPHAVDKPPRRFDDEVSRGELLWGYPNDRSDPPPPASAILDNGTFLVVRKLRQHVRRFHAFVDKWSGRRGIDREVLYGKILGRKRNGRVMLRWPRNPKNNKFDYSSDKDGERCPFQAHIRRTNPRAEREGRTQRPTPRILRRGLSYGPPVASASETDDLVDRGVMFMAYGASISEQYEVIQRWVNGGNPTGVGSWLGDPLMGIGKRERALPRIFRFRYFPGSSTEEQIGGETTGAAGAAATAVAGDLDVPASEDTERRRYVTKRVPLTEPFVELQWGTYLFVPSMAAIRTIARLSLVQTQVERASLQSAEERRGERIIRKLRTLAASGPDGLIAAAAGWKACLEDYRSKDPGERADGPAVWAATRANHGGAIRVPYGIVAAGGTPDEVVLVAGKDLVMRVFANRDENYSMCGQMGRMKQSFGPIFLGLDGGKEYDEKSAINPWIYKIKEPAAFAIAYLVALKHLEGALKLFADMKFPPDPPSGEGIWGELDLRRDFVTTVLGIVCHIWFGIPDTPAPLGHKPGSPPAVTTDVCPVNHVDMAGWGWDPVRKPRCPGDFLATSRYCFYPDPVPRVQAYGKAQGQALRKAVRAHFNAVTQPKAPVAAAMNQIPVYRDDRDEFARTLIGIMTGFLPPTDASLRWTLYEWLEEKLFWRLQHSVQAAQVDAAQLPADADFEPVRAVVAAELGRLKPAYARAAAVLSEPLMQAMQKRPSPDMLWRTSVKAHKLGSVDVEDGDRVFVGIVSAMAEDANAGVTDVYPVFGGRRGGEHPPLHACPALKFAMGTMLGILAALMDRVRLEALPAPLLVRISDPVTAPPGTDPSPPVHAETGGPEPSG